MSEKAQNRSMLIIALPVLVAIVSIGCNLSGALPIGSSQAEPTPTRTPFPTFTPTPADLVQLAPINNQPEADQPEAPAPEQQPAEPTVEPTATPIPQPTDTPTPEGASINIVQNMNIRNGPSTDYPIVGAAAVGESFKILGRNQDSTWYQIEFSGNLGWIFGPLVEVLGNTNVIPFAQAPPAPPTPTPVPTEPPPPQEEAPPPEPVKSYQFTPDGFWGTENAGIVHFKGRLRDEARNLVNGYSVLIDNGAFRIISHPAGPSHHYPEKGPGEWDIVIPNPADGVGWWWVTVVRYDCPNFAHMFDAQCKQYTKLSEDIKILMNWPDETVLNADWTCHWDCDKGLYSEGFLRNNPGGFRINQ